MTKPIIAHSIGSIAPLCELCDICQGYNPIRECIEALNEIAWCTNSTTQKQIAAKSCLSHFRDKLIELDQALSDILEQRKREREEAEQPTEE